jgi:hypothetical protein
LAAKLLIISLNSVIEKKKNEFEKKILVLNFAQELISRTAVLNEINHNGFENIFKASNLDSTTKTQQTHSLDVKKTIDHQPNKRQGDFIDNNLPKRVKFTNAEVIV